MNIKKIATTLLFAISFTSFSQSIIGSFNTAAVNSNSFVQSIGEIYITPEDNTNISSGLLGIIYQLDLITLSTNQIRFSDNVGIGPNPTKGILNISLNDEIDEVTLFDINGRKIRNYSLINNQIDISELNSGLYFFHFQNTNIKPIKILKK